MSLAAAVLAVLTAMPIVGADPDRPARLATLATSITRATWRESARAWPAGETTSLAALLLTIGRYESGFAARIHADRCRLALGECDAVRMADGSLRQLARSPWQLHASALVPWPAWRTIGGMAEAATDRAAWYAARVLAAARARCARPGHDWVEVTIAAYATGYACRWRGAARRARTFRRYREILDRRIGE